MSLSSQSLSRVLKCLSPYHQHNQGRSGHTEMAATSCHGAVGKLMGAFCLSFFLEPLNPPSRKLAVTVGHTKSHHHCAVRTWAPYSCRMNPTVLSRGHSALHTVAPALCSHSSVVTPWSAGRALASPTSLLSWCQGPPRMCLDALQGLHGDPVPPLPCSLPHHPPLRRVSVLLWITGTLCWPCH